MRHWSQNPGNGNLSEVADFDAAQTRRMWRGDHVLSRLNDIASGEAAASRTSGSATACQERAARLQPMLVSAKQVALLWRGAAGKYHDSVSWILSQEAAARQSIDTANHTMVAHQSDPGEVAGNPTVQAKLHQCEADINHDYAALYSLCSQRCQVDRNFAQMLNSRDVVGEHGDWVALEGPYAAAKSVEDILTTPKALAPSTRIVTHS